MQKRNLEFFLLKFKKQIKMQEKASIYFFLFLYCIIDLSFASLIPSTAGYNASKCYFYYI